MNEEERNGLRKQRRLAREKCKKLQSNWNSLREWIKYEYLLFDNESDERKIGIEILDKMNELEGENNEKEENS